ncbi:MAG: hypothetical protein ORN58_03135, partial [Sediminibacterium sp.]|nr:hypothetical protein [Sediminibacterium sp.]
MRKKLNVAIIGSGNIGTDLLIKTQRSELLECVYFIGRNLQSPGIAKAIAMGIPVSDESIQAILKHKDKIDLIFDATSAKDATYHWSLLKDNHIQIIDMTPAKLGKLCVPSINLDEIINCKNINMITCGGQASIPIAYTLSNTHPNIEYIEVISSIASRSAGPATRLNLDEYVETTEMGLKQFAHVSNSKA